jgi:glucose-1-phosphate cytidylyltransferase
MKNNIKVVILAGGKGTRLREETAYKPKCLVEIGGKPILWHIMKIYSFFGFNNFVICLGYKGNMVRDYFQNYCLYNNDTTIKVAEKEIQFENHVSEKWNVTLAETGEETNTGGRIKKIEKYVDTDYFLATYGDGVADINISKLISFHIENHKIATLTGLHPTSRFGILEIDDNGTVTYFKEKPTLKEWVSGGFFVFNKKIFNFLDENCILEREPFEELVKEKQLNVYKHEGFWGSMDTYKDVEYLNEIWQKQKRWKLW